MRKYIWNKLPIWSDCMKFKTQYLILIENIKYYRKQQNLTQEQLAEIADLSSSYIKQIESTNNFKNIYFIRLVKISKALNVDISFYLKRKIIKLVFKKFILKMNFIFYFFSFPLKYIYIFYHYE